MHLQKRITKEPRRRKTKHGIKHMHQQIFFFSGKIEEKENEYMLI